MISPAAAQARIEDPAFDPRSVVLLERESSSFEPGASVAGSTGTVDYTRTDPHTVRVRAATPRGFVIVLDGYHSGWRAECDGREVPVLRAYGRYCALPTSGGEHVFTLRYAPTWRGPALVACSAAPTWRGPALVACSAGLLATLGLALRGGRGAALGD